MNITGIIWHRNVIDKLAFKHKVTTDEVEEVFDNKPKIRFMEKGDVKDEDVYAALGQTEGGRYLFVMFIYKKSHEALILTARDMHRKERRLYERK